MLTTKKTFFVAMCTWLSLVGCKPDEKILYEPEIQNISGNWIFGRVNYTEISENDTLEKLSFSDLKPGSPVRPVDELPTQITLSSNGTYTSVSHNLHLFFASTANAAAADIISERGLWKMIEGKRLVFDKGVYEFDGSSTRVLNYTLLEGSGSGTNDSLLLKSSDPNAVYDWASIFSKQVGASIARFVMANNCSNIGLFAERMAIEEGFYDATASEHKTLSPFKMGRAKGIRDGFAEVYDSTLNPSVHACYRSFYQARYIDGFNQGLKEKERLNRSFYLQFNFKK